MNILFMTIPITLLLVTLFIIIFLSAIQSDQFEDLETPAHSVLLDEEIDIENKTIGEDTL